MDTDITDPLNLNIHGMEFEKHGISAARVPTPNEFHDVLRLTGRCATATNWWVGCLANYADEWGDEYVQLLDSLDLPYNTVREYARVARAIPPANRLANVPWTHHRDVAALPEPEQKRLLEMCRPLEGESAPRLTKRELKEEIAKLNPEEKPKDGPTKQQAVDAIHLVVRYCDGAGLGDEVKVFESGLLELINRA